MIWSGGVNVFFTMDGTDPDPDPNTNHTKYTDDFDEK